VSAIVSIEVQACWGGHVPVATFLSDETDDERDVLPLYGMESVNLKSLTG
jgi:hypothetical protein